MKKIQEIRAWEKKDTDVLREGTENYRSETKIAQAVRPGQSQPIRPTVQPAMYAFSPMQSGASGAAPQAMPGYAAQGGMTPPQIRRIGWTFLKASTVIRRKMAREM